MLVGCDGGFRFNLVITCMIDANLGNVSAGVLTSEVAFQRKRRQVNAKSNNTSLMYLKFNGPVRLKPS